MPVVTIDKADFYDRLGRAYTKAEFDQLCFEFGVELEEDSDDEPAVFEADGTPARATLKIDIPANRYDLLCIEGIARAFNIFLGRQEVPNYAVSEPVHTLTIDPATAQIRPYAAAAVLRGVQFDKRRYDSFIALQDKLHANLCRARSLVAIGTHDLSTVKGPFTYEARSPDNIKFVPLNQTESMDGHRLMEFYSEHRTLSKFLPLVRDSPVYPVIYDAEGTVCSLPPIINSDHSKITLSTRDVLIECTATDVTKLEVVLDIVVAMFSEYAAAPFTIEPVRIVSEHNGQSRVTPNIAPRKHAAEVAYINSCTGLSQSAEEIAKQLGRMSLTATASVDGTSVDVLVPCTRADVLHACDIMEDVAIAYGYNNLPKTFPDKSATVGQPLPLNKLSDLLRRETAMAGFTEVMPLILCSRDEAFAWLNRKDDGNTAVHLANPKTQEYQIARTTLLPGCLKTVRENRSHVLPIKVFEVSDVVFKDASLERGSFNRRHLCAVIAGSSSNFETIHGLLDRLMLMLDVVRASAASEGGNAGKKAAAKKSQSHQLYHLEPLSPEEDRTFFPGRAAAVYLTEVPDSKPIKIGTLGVLHPTVTANFDLPLVASALELDIQHFL
ncbi:phenylalanine--tRNA ligase subunit beta [Savitreella phatthalungensis]